jgi:hypothetical protein
MCQMLFLLSTQEFHFFARVFDNLPHHKVVSNDMEYII